MNFDIQSLGFSMTDELSEHAKRRLRFVLTRQTDRIVRVSMRLGDCNGRMVVKHLGRSNSFTRHGRADAELGQPERPAPPCERTRSKDRSHEN